MGTRRRSLLFAVTAGVLLASGATAVVAALPDPPPAVASASQPPSMGAFQPTSESVPDTMSLPTGTPSSTVATGDPSAVDAAGQPDSVPATAGTQLPTAPSADPRITEQQSVSAVATADPITVRIPSIDVASALTRVGLAPDRSLVVPSDYTVAGWFSQGRAPGARGPAVLVGHVDSTDGPGVFFRLGELQVGDTILVDRADGTTADFRIERVEMHSKSEFPTQAVYGWTDSPTLRLITCGGPFDSGRGSYLDNVIVYANLFGTQPTS